MTSYSLAAARPGRAPARAESFLARVVRLWIAHHQRIVASGVTLF
ncbi:hypothetical protein [Lichenibacterium ramalinae]|nr:hypothetical protein [Lichenibacterium ramalinae]